jgi:hypothetical protein
LSIYNRDGLLVDESGFESLSGFPDAAQYLTKSIPGPLIAEIRVPGFQPTRYALTLLIYRVTVLVIVAEDGGEIAIEQFLFPTKSITHRYRRDDYLGYALTSGVLSAENIQRLEMAQRYYVNGQQIPAEHLLDLLYGKWVDPLLGCLAGYSLIRTAMAVCTVLFTY